jgi:uncharacterized protein YjiK
MKSLSLALLTAAALLPTAALAQSSIDLSQYVRVGRYDLPEPTRTTPPDNFSLLAAEASAVTYNRDTDTLFVLGDSGTSIVQISKTGQYIDSMTLAADRNQPQGSHFYDTEGLTYVGNGQFVMAEERYQQVDQFTYKANTTLTGADVKTVKLGSNVDNIGIEGISYDPSTGGYVAVKEKQPSGIFLTNIDFNAGTASNGSATKAATNLFNPAALGMADFADVYALSNSNSFAGTAAGNNLLVLSQESGKIVETDRAGNVLSSLSFKADGGGDSNHPQLWVYAIAAVPEPSGYALALGGFGLLAAVTRRKRHRTAP